MFTDPFSTLSTFDKAATVALYLTLAVIAVMAVIGILVRRFKPDSKTRFNEIALGSAVGYSVGLAAILLFLKLDDYIVEGYIDNATFIPVVVLLCTVLLAAVAGIIVMAFKKEKLGLFAKICGGILAAVALGIFIYTTVMQYKNNGAYDVSSEVGLYIFTAIIVAAVIVPTFIFGKKHVSDTKSIVYGAMCIAMSFALSYIRFLELPQGGSITFASLVPMMIYSYMFGIRKGVLLGAVYGLFQFIQSPWFYHPIQFLLDYPIAFMAIGITGIFHELKILDDKRPLQFALGALIGVILRYFSHVVSGIYVFGSGDPDNYGAVAWSFLYNSFTFADLAIALVAGCSLMASRQFTRLIDSQSQLVVKNETNSKTEEETN